MRKLRRRKKKHHSGLEIQLNFPGKNEKNRNDNAKNIDIRLLSWKPATKKIRTKHQLHFEDSIWCWGKHLKNQKSEGK